MATREIEGQADYFGKLNQEKKVMSDLDHVKTEEEQLDIQEQIDSTESSTEEKDQVQEIANAVADDLDADFRVHTNATIKLILDKVEILEHDIAVLKSAYEPGGAAA